MIPIGCEIAIARCTPKAVGEPIITPDFLHNIVWSLVKQVHRFFFKFQLEIT